MQSRFHDMFGGTEGCGLGYCDGCQGFTAGLVIGMSR